MFLFFFPIPPSLLFNIPHRVYPSRLERRVTLRTIRSGSRKDASRTSRINECSIANTRRNRIQSHLTYLPNHSVIAEDTQVTLVDILLDSRKFEFLFTRRVNRSNKYRGSSDDFKSFETAGVIRWSYPDVVVGSTLIDAEFISRDHKWKLSNKRHRWHRCGTVNRCIFVVRQC